MIAVAAMTGLNITQCFSAITSSIKTKKTNLFGVFSTFISYHSFLVP